MPSPSLPSSSNFRPAFSDFGPPSMGFVQVCLQYPYCTAQACTCARSLWQCFCITILSVQGEPKTSRAIILRHLINCESFFLPKLLYTLYRWSPMFWELFVTLSLQLFFICPIIEDDDKQLTGQAICCDMTFCTT